MKLVLSSNRGFSLIELILVLVVLGVIALTSSSRFAGVDNFAAHTLQDQVISVIRQVQLNRMQSNLDTASGADFQLQVSNSCIGSQASCTSQDPSRSDWVDANYYSGKQVSFSVSGATPSQIIAFDLLGNPAGVTQSGAISILINAASASSTCQVNINAQGYVFAGACS